MEHNNERKHKHLEFIQLVITRMNINSFLIKGWTVTLIAALFALAAKDANIKYVIITYISTPVFWGLDAYYLSQERKYRKLYNNVRQREEANIDYGMDASMYKDSNSSFLNSIVSVTLLGFYGCLLGLTVIVMIIMQK